MKNIYLLKVILLPVILAGCLTIPNNKVPSVDDPCVQRKYQRTKYQTQQTNYYQQKRKTKTVNVYNQPPVMIPAPYVQPRPVRAPAYAQPAPAPQAIPVGQQEQPPHQALEAQEARDLEQATQNSLATYAEETRRREEARQIEQARRKSLRTYAEEEARQIEQAKAASLQTYAQEQARHQQAEASAQPIEPRIQPVSIAQSAQVNPVAPVPAPEVAPVQKWKPKENDLIQAGNKVVELKNQNGGKMPTHNEMSSHIQSSMGMPAENAEKVLKKLGL